MIEAMPPNNQTFVLNMWWETYRSELNYNFNSGTWEVTPSLNINGTDNAKRKKTPLPADAIVIDANLYWPSSSMRNADKGDFDWVPSSDDQISWALAAYANTDQGEKLLSSVRGNE